MRILAATVLTAALITPAAAQDFSCRNEQAEIRCEAGKCDVDTENVTPMSLHRNGAELEICAGPGCWRGATLVRRTRGGIDLLYADVRRVEPDSDRTSGASEPLAVIYDREARTALMHWYGFSQPMSCGQ